MTKAPDWRVGEGYEQMTPGLYIYDNETGKVVISELDEVDEDSMERISLCVQMCSGLTNEQMKAAISTHEEMTK